MIDTWVRFVERECILTTIFTFIYEISIKFCRTHHLKKNTPCIRGTNTTLVKLFKKTDGKYKNAKLFYRLQTT